MKIPARIDGDTARIFDGGFSRPFQRRTERPREESMMKPRRTFLIAAFTTLDCRRDVRLAVAVR